MAQAQFDDLLEVCKALANPTRLHIMGWLREPTSQFMAVLQRAGLVQSARIGQWTYLPPQRRPGRGAAPASWGKPVNKLAARGSRLVPRIRLRSRDGLEQLDDRLAVEVTSPAQRRPAEARVPDVGIGS